MNGALGRGTASLLLLSRNPIEIDLWKRGDTVSDAENWGNDRIVDASELMEALGQNPHLSLKGVHIRGDVRLPESAAATSLVLANCSLDGKLDVSEGRLRKLHLVQSRLKSVNGERVVVDGDVLIDGVECTGKIDMSRARIAGNVRVSGHLSGLSMSRAHVGGNLTLKSIIVNGSVKTAERDILRLDYIEVAGELNWGSDIQVRSTLAHASVDSFRLPPLRDRDKWPEYLKLYQMTYREIQPDTDERVLSGWLRALSRNRGLRSQTFEQLAKFYREQGRPDTARRVLIARGHARRDKAKFWYRPIMWLYYGSCAYGYRPQLLLVWLVIISLGATSFFALGTMDELAQNVPPYNAAIYALDTAVPVVDLGQQKYWMPSTQVGLWWYWSLIILGWIFAAAGISGVVNYFSKRN
jgi:cytoskeletal protein CcmA (bactofilin family)